VAEIRITTFKTTSYNWEKVSTTAKKQHRLVNSFQEINKQQHFTTSQDQTASNDEVNDRDEA